MNVMQRQRSSLTENLPPLVTSCEFSSHFSVGGGSPSKEALNFAVAPSSVNCLRGFTINDGFDSRIFLTGHKDILSQFLDHTEAILFQM